MLAVVEKVGEVKLGLGGQDAEVKSYVVGEEIFAVDRGLQFSLFSGFH